jgi:hypothetical protein
MVPPACPPRKYLRDRQYAGWWPGPAWAGSEVSIRVAGRVVPVMRLIASWCLQAGPLNHDDGASWWF